jgi:hypothetical protein
VGFEPTIPLFEQAKTFYVLDRAAIVMAPNILQLSYFKTVSNNNRSHLHTIPVRLVSLFIASDTDTDIDTEVNSEENIFSEGNLK